VVAGGSVAGRVGHPRGQSGGVSLFALEVETSALKPQSAAFQTSPAPQPIPPAEPPARSLVQHLTRGFPEPFRGTTTIKPSHSKFSTSQLFSLTI
jgi:hypothetical protein